MADPVALVHWLRSQFARHKELEDKECADLLESQAARIAELENILRELEELHRGWCNFCKGELKWCGADGRVDCTSARARRALASPREEP